MNAEIENTSLIKVAPSALALPSNPWSEIATELDKVLGAPAVKFTKDGTFALSDTDSVPAGTRCVARIDLVQTGWVKWLDNLVVRRIMGLVAESFVPPARATLDDIEENNWPIDNKGKSRDPWQFQMVLPITRLDTDETLNFTTGSKGGLGAINKLIRTYGSRLARGGGGLPIVELRSDFYKHREYGKIFFPAFLITSWTDNGGKPLSVKDDLEDTIPF